MPCSGRVGTTFGEKGPGSGDVGAVDPSEVKNNVSVFMPNKVGKKPIICLVQICCGTCIALNQRRMAPPKFQSYRSQARRYQFPEVMHVLTALARTTSG